MKHYKLTSYLGRHAMPLLAVLLFPMQAFSNELADNTKVNSVPQAQLLTVTQAGNFVIGKQINAGKQETGERVKKNTITRMEEGEQIENRVFEVYTDDRVALEIKGRYDYKTKQSNNTIREITVLSPAYKTVEGIGVGSTLSQALEAYPQGVLYYSYVCDCIWLENGTQYAMQFHIDKAHYQKTLPTHYDSVEIQPADVSSGAKIYKVRIFGT